MRKMQWQATVQEVDNGYVVRVGCKLLVFTDHQKLIDEMTAYIKGEETTLSKKLKQDEQVGATACVPEESCEVDRPLTDQIAR